MSNDPWDGLPNGNYQKWEDVGTELVGDVIGKGIGTDTNGAHVPELVVRRDDGSEITCTCSQGQLRAKVLEARPQIGDRIKIVFTKTENRGAKTLKHFDVMVKSGGAKSPVTQEAVAAAAEDF